MSGAHKGPCQLAQSFVGSLTAFGLNSSLWKNPPVIIFLLNVTTSAGSSRPQCSCAQNFPVQPPPVCTSSTKNAQPCCRDLSEKHRTGVSISKTKIPPSINRYIQANYIMFLLPLPSLLQISCLQPKTSVAIFPNQTFNSLCIGFHNYSPILFSVSTQKLLP